MTGNVMIFEQFWREDYKVLVVVLSVFETIHARKSVRRIGSAREIFEGKPKVLENLHPSSLTMGKFL